MQLLSINNTDNDPKKIYILSHNLELINKINVLLISFNNLTIGLNTFGLICDIVYVISQIRKNILK